jgi:colanic acid biosynthesis glycosyl transferase WcaI
MLIRLHNKNLPKQNTSLLPNWVDTHLIFPMDGGSNPFRSSLGLKDDQVVVLYAGNMGKKQGLEQLIVTARELMGNDHIQFVLCGDGAMRAELESTAQGLPNVRFLPVQPFEALNNLLNMADIHILLQRADAADLVMPSKLTGMLASGKAIIATAHPQTELGQVINAVGMLIPPEDPIELKQAILGLSSNPAQRSELGKKGRDFSIKNLDSRGILNQFEINLQHLVEK